MLNFTPIRTEHRAACLMLVNVVLLQIHAVLVNSPYTNVVTVDIAMEDGEVGTRRHE